MKIYPTLLYNQFDESHSASGMLEPVVVNQEAEKSFFDTIEELDEADEAHAARQSQAPAQTANLDTPIDDDDYENDDYHEAPPVQDFSDDVGPMRFDPYTDDAGGDSSFADEGVRKGAESSSEWIYSNLSHIVQELTYNTSKIDDRVFLKNIEERSTRQEVESTIHKINTTNREKLKWGRLHEQNIKEPLAEWMAESGAEMQIPSWAKLLVGVIIISFITYRTTVDIKKHNDILVQQLIKEFGISKKTKTKSTKTEEENEEDS